ncbi:zinc finger protein 260-like [Lutzomyia longipalpis]|uniref:zinc finger protein 260-like n=1 Tax=Lutzomyia longipalpis TaxID=7200 RepID=UPI00248385DA|nr:zinc finger protein 260-like [Lutzomyia longipalpis]
MYLECYHNKSSHKQITFGSFHNIFTMEITENPSKRCLFIQYLCKRIAEFHNEALEHENSVPRCQMCSEEPSELTYIKNQLFLIVKINFQPKDEENPLYDESECKSESTDSTFDILQNDNSKDEAEEVLTIPSENPEFVEVKIEDTPVLQDISLNRASAKNRAEKLHADKGCECEYCGRIFVRKGNLAMHFKSHCKEKVKLKITDRLKARNSKSKSLKEVKIDKQKCLLCQRTYKRKHDCTSERPKASNIISCSYCPEKFSTYKKIYLHHKANHPDKPRPLSPYQCDICGTFALHLHALKRHMSIHSGDMPFNCDICHKDFRTRYQLTEHQRKHIPKAEKDDKYKCDICQKKFKFRQSLKKHKDHQHTNSRKLYLCNFCGGKFVSEATLLHHQTTHDGEAPRTHKCDQCGRIFEKLKYFNHHRKIQHNIYTDLMLNPKNKKKNK